MSEKDHHQIPGPAVPETTRDDGPEDGLRERPTRHRRIGGKRKPLSCLACRNHKLRCDRRVPCGTCVRYHREAQCRQNPAPLPPVSGRRRTRKSTTVHIPSPPTDVTHPTIGREQICNDFGARDSSPAASEVHSCAPDVESSWRDNVTERLPGASSIQDGVSLLAAFDMERSAWPSLRQLLAEASHSHQSSATWDSMVDPQYRRKLAEQQLWSVLPSRPQCDLLLNFFLEHINYLFQTVHEPSFRRDYARFWDVSRSPTDFIWTSLLFTILSVSALHVPLEAMDVVGLPRQAIRGLGHIWHLASSHALRAGDHEVRPCLVQLQTFSITQLYWYATNQIEVLNS